MPTYLLLIQYDPTIPDDGGPSLQPEHAQLVEVMRSHGHHLSGGGLVFRERYVKQVRHEGGAPLQIDGPFAETREALGGYYVVECSEAEALDYAKRIPVDSRSWIEVRRVGIYQKS